LPAVLAYVGVAGEKGFSMIDIGPNLMNLLGGFFTLVGFVAFWWLLLRNT